MVVLRSANKDVACSAVLQQRTRVAKRSKKGAGVQGAQYPKGRSGLGLLTPFVVGPSIRL